MHSGALKGLVVLDLTQMLAGPFCTMMLADHGADVIKIESPEGDMSRRLGPYYPEDERHEYGGYFQSINRNKRSLVLDFKQDPDRETFLKLVEHADVVVENFRAGVMERLGIAYETVCERNPRIVYAALRGFGDPRTGDSPYRDWPAFDVIAQAMGGFMGITGPGEPMKSGPGIGDILPGVMLGFGILAACRHAEHTGDGQFLDIAMYDAMLSLCERIVYLHGYTGDIPAPVGNKHPLAAPFSIFPVRDGHVAIACPFDAQWRILTRIMEQPELADDPRFNSVQARAKNVEPLTEILDAWTSQFSKAEIAEHLGSQIPFGPVNNVADIFADPHIRQRGMLADIELPEIGRRATVASTPLHLAKTPGKVDHRAPRLGEHNDEILRQFKLV